MGTHYTCSQQAPWVAGMDSSGDWVGRWCFLAAASYFILVFFSLLLSAHFFSCPGSPQATVPFGYPCSSVDHPFVRMGAWIPMGCNTFFDNVLFHMPPSSPVSAYISLSHSSSHLFLCLVCFPLSCPHMIPEEVGTALTGHIVIEEKLPSRITLGWAERLPSSYPSSCSIYTELSTTPGLCISTKCCIRMSKTRGMCFIGSDHQA